MSQGDTDLMIRERQLQREQRSPALRQIEAEEQEAIKQRRQSVQLPEWLGGEQQKPIEEITPEDDAPASKEVELTGSDDFLPYLDDIRGDHDTVQMILDDEDQGRSRADRTYSNEYMKPNRRTIRGIDMKTGVRHLNIGDYNVPGVEEHTRKGVELIGKANMSADYGPDEKGLQGAAHVATAIQLEGGSYADLERALDQTGIPKGAARVAWNAAARASIQQTFDEELSAPPPQEELDAIEADPLPDLTTDDLINNSDWLDSALYMWEAENGAKFNGSKQELVDWSLNEMSNFNWRILGAPGVNGTSMAYYATQATLLGGDYAKALLNLIDMYDRVETDPGIVKRSLGAAFSDPTMYAGLGFGKGAAWVSSKVMKNRLKKWLVEGAMVGAGEGAIYAGGEDLARQTVEKSAGAREEIDPGQAATSAAIGAGVGAAVGPVIGAAMSPKAVDFYRRTGAKMRQNARYTPRTPMTSQIGAIGDLTANRTAYPEVARAASLSDAFDLASSGKFKNNRELKVALQERVQAAAKSAGVNLAEDTPEANRFLRQMVVADAKTALVNNSNAVGWYDRTVSDALDVLGTLHPEIHTDPDAKFAFTYALAVTSNGLKVDKNFELAEKAYQHYKKTGKMPTDVGVGNASQAINGSLADFNDWVAEYGMDGIRKIMDSTFTVRQLKRAGLKITGEHQSTLVRGAAVLGPKIGNGFFSNLNGRFDQLTMDRWLMRSWGRLTGTLIEHRPDMVRSKRSELQDAIRALKEDPQAFQAYQKAIGGKLLLGDPDATAALIQKASMTPATRKLMNETEAGDLLRRTGNSLVKYIDGQKEAPTVNDRNRIRAVFARALADLRNDGYDDMTMADLQALLWYPEKRLYDKAKSAEDVAEGYADDEAPDYANAAIALAKSQGITDNQIKEVLDNGRAARAGRSEPQPGQAEQGGDEGFDPKSRKRFLIREVYAASRPRKAGNGKARSHRARSDGGDRSVRGVVQTFEPTANFEKLLGDAELSPVTIEELKPSRASGFEQAISQAKASNRYGAAVYVYGVDDYANMRMFMTPDQQSGFAIKEGGDIVSVFAPAGSGNVYQMIQLAVEQGGTKLDAFDTALSDIYAACGFKEVDRVPWDDQYMPDGWDKETFSRYNGGEPDVVFMEYSDE